MRLQTIAVAPGEISLASLRFSPHEPLPALPSNARPHVQTMSMRRRRQFLAGRWCASQALAHAGCEEDCHLDRDARGLPKWPRHWLGSISHTDDRAVAAVAPATAFLALGVDTEHILQPEAARRLRVHIATNDELVLLSHLGMAHAVTLLFSAKEALYKALYPQVKRFMDFDAARLKQCGGHLLVFELSQAWSETLPCGHRVYVRFCLHSRNIHTLAWL